MENTECLFKSRYRNYDVESLMRNEKLQKYGSSSKRR